MSQIPPSDSKNGLEMGDIENKDIENCLQSYILNSSPLPSLLTEKTINILRGDYYGWGKLEGLNILQKVHFCPCDSIEITFAALKQNTLTYTCAVSLGAPEYILTEIDNEFMCLVTLLKFFRSYNSSKVQ